MVAHCSLRTFRAPDHLENVVRRAGDGLVGFIDCVGHQWGGLIPAAGTLSGADTITMLVSGKWDVLTST